MWWPRTPGGPRAELEGPLAAHIAEDVQLSFGDAPDPPGECLLASKVLAVLLLVLAAVGVPRLAVTTRVAQETLFVGGFFVHLKTEVIAQTRHDRKYLGTVVDTPALGKVARFRRKGVSEMANPSQGGDAKPRAPRG